MSSKPIKGHFRLLYFASAASYTEKSLDDIPAPLAITDLFAHLEKLYPGIRQAVLSSCAVTVNLDYVDVEDQQAAGGCKRSDITVINEGDEVAIIPPVSSG